jgi:hypothetical protein
MLVAIEWPIRRVARRVASIRQVASWPTVSRPPVPWRRGEFTIRIAQEFAGDGVAGIDDGLRAAGRCLGQGILGDGDDDVAAEDQPCLAGGDARRMQLLLAVGEAHVGHHGAALLRQAGHVEHGDALAFEVGGHAEQGADGDHAGAADAGDEDAVGIGEAGGGRLGQRRRPAGLGRQRLAAAHAAAMHGDHARAEAVEAGEILVAGELVDGALAAELGFHRHHGEAVGLGGAVAAAFADGGVDEDALRRVGEAAALAAAALLGGAGLVVDEGADAPGLAQLALGFVEPLAVADLDAGGEVGDALVFLRFVAHHDDARNILGGELARQLRHGQRAVHRLAAGHGHGVVEQQLVGDVHLGGDGGADGEQAGMEVGAVAHVGEHVLRAAVAGNAEPGRAFAAHVGDGQGVAAHHHRHQVAADAAQRAAALGHLGGLVVRAAGAEPGRAHQRHLGRAWACALASRKAM